MSNKISIHIREYVKNNQLIEAAKLVQKSPLTKKGIAILSRLNELREKMNAGLIGLDEVNQERNRIRVALLDLADELDKEEQDRINILGTFPKSVWIGGFVSILVLGVYLWFSFINRPETFDCSNSKKYGVIVAHFNKSKHVFSRVVYTNLAQNFSNYDSVRVGALDRYIEPSLLNKIDTLSAIERENCILKGLTVYGSLDSAGNEIFFHCFVRVVNLTEKLIEIKSKKGEVIISKVDLKSPKQISFSVSDRAEKVSDFVTGLLKYYLGDVESAVIFFQKALYRSQFENPKFVNIVRLYLGNSLGLSGKLAEAIKLYDIIASSEEKSIYKEVIWNKATIFWQMGEFEKASLSYNEFSNLKNMNLTPNELKIIDAFNKSIVQTLPPRALDSSLIVLGLKNLEKKKEEQVVTKDSLNEYFDQSLSDTSAVLPFNSDSNFIFKEFLPETESFTERLNLKIDSLFPPLDSSKDFKSIPYQNLERKKLEEIQKMVLVKGGTFIMGDLLSDGHIDAPMHEVSLNSFFIGKYEVTIQEYDKYLLAKQKSKYNDNLDSKGLEFFTRLGFEDLVINIQQLDSLKNIFLNSTSFYNSNRLSVQVIRFRNKLASDFSFFVEDECNRFKLKLEEENEENKRKKLTEYKNNLILEKKAELEKKINTYRNNELGIYIKNLLQKKKKDLIQENQEFLVNKYENNLFEFVYHSGNANSDNGHLPVTNVSWLEAIEYCNWLSEQESYAPVYSSIKNQKIVVDWKANGYRLPTEAEWEYAARSRGVKSRFANGENIANALQLNINLSKPQPHSKQSDFRGVAVKVTELNESENEIGLFHMSGNVWEYCWDFYEYSYYGISQKSNPKGPKAGSQRVMRGGSWNDGAREARVYYRKNILMNIKKNTIGFRVVRNK